MVARYIGEPAAPSVQNPHRTSARVSIPGQFPRPKHSGIEISDLVRSSVVSNSAKMAVARKAAELIYHLLSHGEPWQDTIKEEGITVAA